MNAQVLYGALCFECFNYKDFIYLFYVFIVVQFVGIFLVNAQKSPEAAVYKFILFKSCPLVLMLSSLYKIVLNKFIFILILFEL